MPSAFSFWRDTDRSASGGRSPRRAPGTEGPTTATDRTTTTPRDHRRRAPTLVGLVAALALAPAAAWAGNRFADVPDSNVFHDDIQWMADNGVTAGCNPPSNTRFCPDRPVTREQMAAFMRRLDTRDVFATPADVDARVDGAGHIASDLGMLGYVWACDEDSLVTYDPVTACALDGRDWAHNSTGGEIEILRDGAGSYGVRFEGLASPGVGGTVGVTPYEPGVCVVVGWEDVLGDVVISIDCYDFDGNSTDLRFTLQFIA